MEVYAEYGAVGVIVLLFIGALAWIKGFVSNLVDNELVELQNEIVQNRDIQIKLIDRWNKSDESRDRRHEDVIKELNDVSDDLAYIKGRMNSRG